MQAQVGGHLGAVVDGEEGAVLAAHVYDAAVGERRLDVGGIHAGQVEGNPRAAALDGHLGELGDGVSI